MTYSLRSATLRLRRALLSTVAPMVACCLMLALAACDGGPRLATLAPDATVLAFGDSLTAGKGAGRGEDYPSRLAPLTGLQVINAGVSGELSAAGHERLPALLAEHRPDLVLLCHGGNDILRRNGSESMQANLRNMVHTARAAGAEVVLLAVPTLGSACARTRSIQTWRTSWIWSSRTTSSPRCCLTRTSRPTACTPTRRAMR
jgi:acyl-CoA thioesterase-1